MSSTAIHLIRLKQDLKQLLFVSLVVFTHLKHLHLFFQSISSLLSHMQVIIFIFYFLCFLALMQAISP